MSRFYIPEAQKNADSFASIEEWQGTKEPVMNVRTEIR